MVNVTLSVSMMLSLSCRSSIDEGPRTPSSSSPSPYRPHTSSPLLESFSPSPSTSAAAKLQSRRLAQYKSITTPTTRRVSSAYHSRSKHPGLTDQPNFGVRHSRSVAASPGDVENNLRDRLRQRCAHRAQRAHTKRVQRDRRRNGLSSSDGEEMDVESDDDEENEVELGLNDELFHRIIDSAKHKHRYSYRLSFQNDVGSSIDPDMDDVAEWERNLQDGSLCREEPDLPLSEFDEEEIAERAAEAEEAELWADFNDSDTVFGLSDINEVDLKPHAILDEDVDMA